MKPMGHWHTYERCTPERGQRKGRTSGQRQLYVCTGCTKRVWTARREGPSADVYPWGLTQRLAETLNYLADGRRIPYIAYYMGISIRVVQNNISLIKRAMGGDLEECVEAWRNYERSLKGARAA